MHSLKIIAVLLSILLSSCATMNQDECLTANWQAKGFEEGSQGQDFQNFNKHLKACAKHGVTANYEQYQKGYQQGITHFCTPQRGYQLGKNNSPIPNVCPTELMISMQNAYQQGHRLFIEKQLLKKDIEKINQNIQQLDRKISLLNNEIKEHQNYLKLADTALKNKNIPASERLVFYTQGAQLKKLIEEANEDIKKIQLQKKPFNQSINNINKKIQFLNNQAMPTL